MTPDRRSEEGSGDEDGSEKKRSSRIRKSGTSSGGGFLRDSIFGNGTLLSTDKASDRKEGKRKLDYAGLQAENKRLAGSTLSGDSSVRSSPLSREVSISQPAQNDVNTEPRSSTMDPAQLVKMALSLSESRKRHTSGSLPIPIAAPRVRNISGAHDKYGTVRTRGSDRARSSSRFDPSPVSSSHSRDRQSTPSASAIDDNVLYTFSPATLARAEKTRKYFELASEHRRLLECLPPLKPDAQATANYTFESRSSPGYAQPDIQRVRSNTLGRYELGRQYNPLQILRNRRLRNRERRPLTVPPESFEDTQRVTTWMDDVEEAARQPAYRSSDDIVHLPHYSHDPDGLDGSNGAGKGHRRTGTAGTVVTRPENEWAIDPTERLADTYWTEQGDNKMLLENRRRQAIFPARARLSVNESRKSEELNRDQNKDSPMEVTEKEPQKEQASRKHRHLLSLHKADRIRHNKFSRFRRSASASSGSSDEGRKPRPAARGQAAIDSSAPLNKHMDALITKELRGNTSSPDLDSPDHWDSKNTPFPTRGEHRGSIHRANGSLSVPATVTAQRSKSADGRLAQLAEIDRTRFSFDSSPPDSPAVADFMPSLAMDLSPPRKAATSTQKHKRRVLPVFRSKSKDRSTTEGKDFAFPSDSDRSRDPSGNAIDSTRLSAEYARPVELHRHQTSESMRSSLHRRGTSRTHTTSDGSIKEPSSTVGRFFKGGRLAELVRTGTDRRGRKDKEGSLTDVSAIPSDASDTEGSVGEPSLTIGSPHDSEPSPRTSIDRVRGKKGLHTANLPTFKSAAGREKPLNSRLTPVISRDGDDDDHIGRQAAVHRGASRSPRIDRLLPPRINLPDDSDHASTAGFQSETSDVIFAEPNRKSYGFLSPKGGAALGSNVSFNTSSTAKQNGDYPVTGLTKLGANGARRHWSISDRGMLEKQRQDLLKTHRISPRDLSRARALILASGVKAHNLVLRANSPAVPAPRFLTAAAKTASVDTPSVPLKETHLRAAIILSSHLDKSLESLSQARQAYQSNTSHSLHTRQADLKSLVADKLTHTVQNSSDEADAFGVRLTTEQTLRIKQVDDAVDEILRMRRRQFRLMRRAGFKLLEWLVLGIMWWVWFVVVCWKSVKRVILGVVRMLKWLFSF